MIDAGIRRGFAGFEEGGSGGCGVGGAVFGFSDAVAESNLASGDGGVVAAGLVGLVDLERLA